MADVSLAVEPVATQITESGPRTDVVEAMDRTVAEKTHKSPPKESQSRETAKSGSGTSSPAKTKPGAKLSPPRSGAGGGGKAAPSPKKNPWSKRPQQSPPSSTGGDEKKKSPSSSAEGKAASSSSGGKDKATAAALPSKSIKIPGDEVCVWGSPSPLVL